jgi:hypothetical protein
MLLSAGLHLSKTQPISHSLSVPLKWYQFHRENAVSQKIEGINSTAAAIEDLQEE